MFLWPPCLLSPASARRHRASSKNRRVAPVNLSPRSVIGRKQGTDERPSKSPHRAQGNPNVEIFHET
jgi:hypothetical protein